MSWLAATEDDPSAVARWLRLAAAETPNASELDLDSLTRVNVVRQLDNLKAHPLVAERVERKELALWAWVYDVGSSEIVQRDESSGEFRSLDSFETAV